MSINRVKYMRGRSRVVGGRKLRMTLQQLPKYITAEVVEVMGEYARAVQQDAARRVPVRTGNLRATILMKGFVGKKSNGFGWEVGFRTKRLQRRGWYAHFVEFGTKGYRVGEKKGRKKGKARRYIPPRRAQPFLGPALKAQQLVFRPKLEHAIQVALDKAVIHWAAGAQIDSAMARYGLSAPHAGSELGAITDRITHYSQQYGIE